MITAARLQRSGLERHLRDMVRLLVGHDQTFVEIDAMLGVIRAAHAAVPADNDAEDLAAWAVHPSATPLGALMGMDAYAITRSPLTKDLAVGRALEALYKLRDTS